MSVNKLKWSLDSLLKEKGMTKYKLAGKSGLSLPTIYNIEKQTDLNLSTIIAICNVLEVEISDIIKIKSKNQ